MSMIENNAAAGLVERAKNILLTPQDEWDKIAQERVDVGKLYLGYALPLLILSALCMAIGMSLFGVGGFGIHVRVPWAASIATGVTQVVLGLVGLFGFALIIKALAPTFGAQPNQDQAHKLAVYGATASLLAGVFLIYPALGVLGILGLYSLVLLYLGLPRLMGVPEDKRVGYFIAILVVAIVAGVILGAVTSTVRAAVGGFGAGPVIGGTTTGGDDMTFTLPGGVTIDAGQARAAAEQMEAAAGGVSVNGAALTNPVDLEALQALLPASLPGGFERTEISSVSGAMAMGMAQAQAIYRNGDRSITLSAMHMGPMAAMGGLGMFGVQGNRQDADGYERVRSDGGRTIVEGESRSEGSARYGVITAAGAAVMADGQGVSVDQVRAAAETINPQRIEQLAQ